MSEQERISQEMLHAYADGQLTQENILDVEAWLAAHPADAASVHAYKLQNAQLQQAFGAVASEDVPAEMTKIITKGKISPSKAAFPWMQMAAALLLLLVGGFAGWGIQFSGMTGNTSSGSQVFAQSAIGAHRVFVSEVRHPVEVPASQQRHLVNWLSKRLGTTLTAPDIEAHGFTLVGGRLLSDGDFPAAQFMYQQEDGKRVTLYVRASDGNQDTAFQFARRDGISAFYWIDKTYAYAMVAPLEKEDLMTLATLVYHDLEKN
ncbi:MAG: anti-sigma factor [Sneathiella sp.]